MFVQRHAIDVRDGPMSSRGDELIQ